MAKAISTRKKNDEAFIKVLEARVTLNTVARHIIMCRAGRYFSSGILRV